MRFGPRTPATGLETIKSVINSRNHWQNWTFPPGTLVISPEGAVQAQRIEKNTNAALDIVDYLRFNPPPSLGDKDPETITLADAIEGRSNVADVAKVFDGDMTTYWEPAPPSDEVDLALQWWFYRRFGPLSLRQETRRALCRGGSRRPLSPL